MNLLFTVLPLVSSAFLMACYVPQLKQTFTTKNVEGVSMLFWILLCTSLTSTLINNTLVGIDTGNWTPAIMVSVNWVLAMTMMILVSVIKLKQKKVGK